MRPGVSALSRLLCRRVEESGLRLDRWAFGVNAEVELVPAIHIPAAPAYPAALEGAPVEGQPSPRCQTGQLSALHRPGAWGLRRLTGAKRSQPLFSRFLTAARALNSRILGDHSSILSPNVLICPDTLDVSQVDDPT
jgi:hypothetical protein